MSKLTLRVPVGQNVFLIDYSDVTEFEIEKLSDWVNDTVSKGAKFIEFEVQKDYDGDIESITIISFDKELETDEQYQKRLDEDEKIKSDFQKHQEKQDLIEYERLKKKFE